MRRLEHPEARRLRHAFFAKVALEVAAEAVVLPAMAKNSSSPAINVTVVRLPCASVLLSRDISSAQSIL